MSSGFALVCLVLNVRVKVQIRNAIKKSFFIIDLISDFLLSVYSICFYVL